MPLLWLSLAFLTGIVIADIWTLPVSSWLGLAAVPLGLLALVKLVGALIRREPDLSRFLPERLRGLDSASLPGRVGPALPVLVPLVVCVLFLGAARYQASLPTVDEGFIGYYNDRQTNVVVTGVVVDFPDRRDTYINLRVAAEKLREEDSYRQDEVEGLMLARVPTDGDWHYGDRILLRGRLETPPEAEDFSYRDYLARQGVYSLMPLASATLIEAGQGNPLKASLLAFRERALDLVYRLFPDPEASLFAGILLGVESGISADVKEAFNATGTSHVIAISGFNVTIIAGLFTLLFRRWLGPRWGTAVSAVGIGIYTVLVGADPPVVRAALMAWLAMLARQSGRRQTGVNTLAFTAALMALFDPQLPWDVGFQLSCAATLGLVLYTEPLSQGFVKLASRWLPETTVERLVGPVGEYFLFTIAAQITTLPLIAYHFQRLSPISLPANFAILPAQPPIMVLGGLAVLAAMAFYPLGQGLAYLAWPFAAYTIRAVEWFAKAPGGALALGQVSLVPIALYYLVLFGATLWRERLTVKLPAIKPVTLFAGLALLTGLVWGAVFSAPDGRLHVTFLDVGSGDAILIQSPSGHYVLIDGGPSLTKLSDGLGRRLPLFQRRLDFLVVGSPREEEAAALPYTVERFRPGEVLWAGERNLSRSARFLEEQLVEQGVAIIFAEGGQTMDLGEGARLEVLASNDEGAILLLTWKSFRLVLPLGVEEADMETIAYGGSVGPVTALLLAEQGKASLNSPDWIANLDPQIVLLSVAAGDRYGMPDPETLASVAGRTLLRTDLNGWIQLTTDGEQIWVEVERP